MPSENYIPFMSEPNRRFQAIEEEFERKNQAEQNAIPEISSESSTSSVDATAEPSQDFNPIYLEQPEALPENEKPATGFLGRMKDTIVNIYDTKFGGNTGLPKIERQLDNYLKHIEFERKISGTHETPRLKELHADHAAIKEQYLRCLKRQSKERGTDFLTPDQRRILMIDHMENGAKSMHSKLELNKLGFKNWNDLFSRGQLSQEKIKQVIQESGGQALNLEDSRNGFQRLFPAAKDAIISLTLAGAFSIATGGVALVPMLGAALGGAAGGQIARGLFRSRKLRENVDGKGPLNEQLLRNIIGGQAEQARQIHSAVEGNFEANDKMMNPEIREKLSTLRLITDSKLNDAKEASARYWKIDSKARWFELFGKIAGADAFAFGNAAVSGVQQAHSSLAGHQDIYRMHGSEVRQVFQPDSGPAPILAPDEHLVRFAVDPATGRGAFHVIEKGVDAAAAHGHAHVFTDAANGFSVHKALNSNVFAASGNGQNYDLMHIANHLVDQNSLAEQFGMDDLKLILPFLIAQVGVLGIQDLAASKVHPDLNLDRSLFYTPRPPAPAPTPADPNRPSGTPPAPAGQANTLSNAAQTVEGGTPPDPAGPTAPIVPNKSSGTPPNNVKTPRDIQNGLDTERKNQLYSRQAKAQDDISYLAFKEAADEKYDEPSQLTSIESEIGKWKGKLGSVKEPIADAPKIVRINVGFDKNNLHALYKPVIDDLRKNGAPLHIVLFTSDDELAKNHQEYVQAEMDKLGLGELDSIQVLKPNKFTHEHANDLLRFAAVNSSTEKFDVAFIPPTKGGSTASEVHKPTNKVNRSNRAANRQASPDVQDQQKT